MYYNNEFNKNRSIMRKMWNTISAIIHKQRKYASKRNVLMITEIANILHDFFYKQGPKLKSIIQKIKATFFYKKYINNSVLSSFNFQLIDDDALKNLNSLRTKMSFGYDGISTQLLEFLLYHQR